jgi:CTP synthase
LAKFVFVSGGVMSGIGKGVTTASIGKILQVRGFKVTAAKIDPYLNVDAGTMNPITHGEVFVTEDGGEIDMDLGTYERFLDINIPKTHNMTTGQVYLSVINQERRGDFLGKCVQIIPQITDEIKRRVVQIATENSTDVAMIEIGGTVGDIESLPFLEAARQMRLEYGHGNVIYAHVTLVPVLDVVGEQKTKPTQHSVQELRRIGIQPDIIVARSKNPLLDDPKRKIALFCNVEENAVFASPDLRTVYETPLVLDRQGLGDYLAGRLELPKRKPDWTTWERMVNSFTSPEHEVRIAMCGKYAELADSYVSVNEALRHSAAFCNSRLSIDWIETETFEDNPSHLQTLSKFDGVLVPGGFGARGTEGKIAAIDYARTKDLPFLGICLGFQLAIVAFARSIGIEAANSTEIQPETPNPVIDLMPEQKKVEDKGATMRLGAHEVVIASGTTAETLYKTRRVFERHRHRYELNPKYMDELAKAGMVFSGESSDGTRVEILELPGRYFHFATQFHGEFKSRPSKPSPPYYGFIRACLDKKRGKNRPEFWK